jgi:hypothetical protein
MHDRQPASSEHAKVREHGNLPESATCIVLMISASVTPVLLSSIVARPPEAFEAFVEQPHWSTEPSRRARRGHSSTPEKQPTMNCIPGDSFDSSDGRLVQTLDTQGGDLIKDCTSMLDSIIWRPSCRAKCLPTNLALVATTLPSCCLVEAMANDGCGAAIFRGRAVACWNS